MATSPETFGVTGYGTHVFASADGGTTFTEILGVKTFTFGGKKKNTDDKTNLLSPGGYVERQPTTRDAGTFTINTIFNPKDPGQILLAASFDATPDQELVIKIQYPADAMGFATSGPVKTFFAWVTDYPEPSADISKVTELAIQLTITGPITTVAGV